MNEVIEKQEEEKLYILLLKYMDEVSLTEFQENYTQQFIEHCTFNRFGCTLSLQLILEQSKQVNGHTTECFLSIS